MHCSRAFSSSWELEKGALSVWSHIRVLERTVSRFWGTVSRETAAFCPFRPLKPSFLKTWPASWRRRRPSRPSVTPLMETHSHVLHGKRGQCNVLFGFRVSGFGSRITHLVVSTRETRNLKIEFLIPRPETRIPNPETRIPKPET